MRRSILLVVSICLLVYGFVGWAQESTIDSVTQRAGVRAVFIEVPLAWGEIDNATGGTATATRAAVAGSHHYITSVSAGCDNVAAVSPTLQIRYASTVEVEVPIQEDSQGQTNVMWSPSVPFKAPVGAAVHAILTTCGASMIGYASITGYTLQDR